MKRKCLVLLVVALLIGSVGYHLSIPQATASRLSEHALETIEPVVDHWPQEEDNWCGAAVLQAYIDYAWRFHHGDENHLYTQSSLWDIMRDFTSSHFFAKGARGIGAALPGEVGDEGSKVRRLNIAYDFGVDPSALTWMMQYYGHDHYHYAVYRDGLYHATRWLLWTVEHYQEPVVAAVLHGSHYVLVIGYEAERSAVDPDGPGEISRVRYADPLFGPGENAYKWRPWDSIWPWVDTWEEYFTEYTAPGDPDPSTGWYVPPPDLWQGARVTVERDEHPDHVNYSPDWAVDGDTWQIMDHHDATYLPDIKANWAGWNSTITIRNNGNSDASASVIFYDPGGYGSGTSMRTTRDNSLIPSGGTWELNASAVVGSFFGSAVVYASEDVSVVVMNIHEAAPYAAGSYVGTSETLSSLYVPLLHRNNWGWHSDFTVFNAGTASAQVTVEYIAETGTGCTTSAISIPPNGSHNFNLQGNPGCALSSPFVGGAHVTSPNGSLVAVANQWLNSSNNPDSYMSYEAFPAGQTSSFLPLLMRNNYDWHTGVQLQDASGSGGTVTFHYFEENSSPSCGSSSHWLASNVIVALPFVPPDGVCVPTGQLFVGAARANRGSAFAAVVNEVNFSPANQNAMSYSASGGGTTTVVLPLVMKNHDGWRGRNDWYTCFKVQNQGSSSTTVRADYYNMDGSWRTYETKQVSGESNVTFCYAPSGGPDSFFGSAVVTAGQHIAVAVNHHVLPGGTEDASMSHIGLNR